MLQKLQRPLTEAERKCLALPLETVARLARLSDSLRWFALWSAVLAACIAVFVLGVSQDDSPAWLWVAAIPFVSIVGIVAFYCAYCVLSGYLHWSRHARRFEREVAPKIRAALDQGLVSVVNVESNFVIVVEEAEDEGSAYIYDLGDGTSLFLRGQEYYSYSEDETSPWPTRRFELVRTALHDLWVGVFPSSGDQAIKIEAVAMGEMPKDFLFSSEPPTESVLPGTAREVLTRLGHRRTS